MSHPLEGGHISAVLASNPSRHLLATPPSSAQCPCRATRLKERHRENTTLHQPTFVVPHWNVNKGKPKEKTPTAVSRDKKLAEVRTKINLLRSALLDLAWSMNGHHYPLDETAWPNVNDPDLHVLAMKRLKYLAEIVHVIGFAVDHITELDMKPATAYARHCVLKFGGKPAKGWSKPLGRAGTAPAKDALLERVRAAAEQATMKGASPAEAIAEALIRWFRWDCGTDVGAGELIRDLKVDIYSNNFKKTLNNALVSVDNTARIDPEDVILKVWKALGASPAFLKNFFSYKDQQLKRSKSKKQGG